MNVKKASHVVSHRSTDSSTTGLTSKIGRVSVLFRVYEHSHLLTTQTHIRPSTDWTTTQKEGETSGG